MLISLFLPGALKVPFLRISLFLLRKDASIPSLGFLIEVFPVLDRSLSINTGSIPTGILLFGLPLSLSFSKPLQNESLEISLPLFFTYQHRLIDKGSEHFTEVCGSGGNRDVVFKSSIMLDFNDMRP